MRYAMTNDETKAALEAAGAAGAFEVYAAWKAGAEMPLFSDSTMVDIVRKLRKYGSITDRTWSFLKSLVEKRPAALAELKSAEDAPTGRVDIDGEILTIKEKETRYGLTLKMLVKDKRGFKVWGTVPRSIREVAEKGDRVTFSGDITPSDDDPKFGFFAYPKSADVHEATAA